MIRQHQRAFVLSLLSGVALFLFQNRIFGAGPDTLPESDVAFFETHIRPLLVEHCYECHGEKKHKGNLRLDSSAAVLQGGDNGPALVKQKPEDSLLIKAVSYSDPDLKMPPKQRLSEAQVTLLKEWIQRGAPDPRTGAAPASAAKKGIDIEAGRKFWAFQPLQKPALPEVKNRSWAQSDLDRFILAKLEEKHLQPSTRADKATLIRRVYFDLTGLPPSPAQIDTFLNDTRPDAYARVVDDLLNSPHFGEHWGRHWLDLARFAESSGGGRTLLFKDAWRYRDYVVDSFNHDKPLDQFIREQIAGDLLTSATPEKRREQLTGLAYLALGPTNYERQDKDVLEMDVIDEQLDVICKGLLGMTVGCARCHDHKFDPIPTADYYALAGILKSTQTLIHENVSKWIENDLPVSAGQERELKEHEAAVVTLQKQIKASKATTAKRAPKRSAIPVDSLPGILMDETQGKVVGDWTHSTYSGHFVGEGYLHDANNGKGQKTITFVPPIKKEGLYEVRFAWVPADNRASNTPVTVLHLDGETTITLNQRNEPPIGERFITLGQFRFNENGQWFVLISNEGTDGNVVVDAVQFIPLDDPEAVKLAGVRKLPMPSEVDKPEMIPFIVTDVSSLPGIVVDDTQAELVGEWKSSVHTPPFVGASYLHDDKTGKGEKSATFRPNLPVDGEYEVRLAHDYNVRRTTNAPVTIHHDGGETRQIVNMQEESPIDRLFVSLGKFQFKAGTNGFVRLTTEGTEGKVVIADAVQFILIPGADAKPLNTAAKKGASAVDAKALEAQLKQLQEKGPKRPLAMGVKDADQIGDTEIRIRGVTANKGAKVPRGFLQVASTDHATSISTNHSGRLELADWLVSADNPLTARVLANRTWSWLTGVGLVRTVDNFGATGEQPTHPELLDWLAVRLRDGGWSIKKLVREIVLSSTYQQSSADVVISDQYSVGAAARKSLITDRPITDDLKRASAMDPENRLYWRMNRRRLPAEAIRDTILVASGQINLEAGGPTIKPGTAIEYGYKFDDTRRSLYTPVFRNTLLEMFESFDFADPNMVVGKRNNSTTATQGLYLMNHPFVMEQADLAAKAALEWPDMDDAQRILRAYRTSIGRGPSERELQLAMEFVTIPTEENATPAKRRAAWARLYQALFASLDFRFVN